MQPQMRPSPTRLWPSPAVITVSLIAVLVAGLWLSRRTAHALPDYTARTGETCAVCHVNPGGGGPRTMRGLLWAAEGRPNQVPSLPNQLLAPDVNDGEELYDRTCAGCHGYKGEGLYAMGLANTGIGKVAVRSYLRRGIPAIGMPAFEGQFTDDQMGALTSYVAGLADGSIAPPPDAYALAPAQFRCVPPAGTVARGCQQRTPIRRGGN